MLGCSSNLLRLLSSCLNRFVWNSFVSQKSGISLWRFWNTRKRYVCEKGNIEGRERWCRQKLNRGTKEMLLTTQVETLHVISHFSTKHLVLWITPKTLDLQGRNRLKDLKELGREFEIARLPTHEKSNCPLSVLLYLRQNSQLCLSHRCKQWQKMMNL